MMSRNWLWQMMRLLCIAMLAMSMAACEELNSDEEEDDDDDDQETLVEGRFVDSPVVGLGYRLDGDNRLTDADGVFEYQEDDNVMFFHGNTSLGRAPGQPFVTPNDLDICDDATEITQQQCVINIVRFLLTHKDDGASNIQLDEDARDDAGILSPVNFDVDPDLFGTVNDTENPGLQNYLAMNAGEGRSGLASVSEAETHLNCSEEDIEAGREPDGVCDSTANSGDGDGDGDGEGDGEGDGTGGGDTAASLCLPADPTGMLCAEQLCAIPELGPTLVEAAGGSCGDGGGAGASPINPAMLCAIPEIGPALAEGIGASCEGDAPDGGGGLCLPGDPTGLLCAEQLCAVPELGPLLVEGAGGSCGTGGDASSPLDVSQLCLIPEIGPAIAEALGGSC